MIVYDQRVADYVAAKCGVEAFKPPFAAIGVEKDGAIVAGSIINNWTGYDCEVSLASDKGCLSLPLLRAMGKYIQNQLGCIRATFVTEQDIVVSIVKRLGGEIEGYKRDYFGPGRPAILVGIVKDDWRL